MLKPKQAVVRIISTPAGETGSLHKVSRFKLSHTAVQLDSDDHLWYDAHTGRELDPAPGFFAAGISSRIVPIEE